MKTWKKIEETKKRTNDITNLKKRNEEKVQKVREQKCHTHIILHLDQLLFCNLFLDLISRIFIYMVMLAIKPTDTWIMISFVKMT